MVLYAAAIHVKNIYVINICRPCRFIEIPLKFVYVNTYIYVHICVYMYA